MPAQRISLKHAKEDKLFYFVANVVIYRESDGRCLILKRSEKERIHPGKYCVPGGKLEWNDFDLARPTRRNGDILDFEDAVENLLTREVQEEAGVEIEKELHHIINSMVFVRPDGIPVVFLKLAGKYKSGEVVIEKESFSEHAWVNAEEVKKYDCIQGIPREIAKTIKIFEEEKE